MKLSYLRFIGLLVLSCIVWGQEPQLEPRNYQVRYFPEQDMLVLSGQECQMYRVDSYCGEVYDFPFKRSR